MDIIINDGVYFRKLVSSIKELTNSTEFLFNEKGISVQAMDIAHICVIDVLIPKETCDKYIIKKPIRLGFNFDNLNNILKLSKTSAIKITYEEGSDKILFNVSDNIHKKIEFEMTLMNVEQDLVEITELEYGITVYLETSEFQKSIKDLASFGDKCTIFTTPDDIIFKVSGEAGTGKISIDDAEIEFNDTDKKEISLTFATKYLAIFAKANLSNEVTLKFSDTNPFCCEYTLDHGHVKFFLGQIDSAI
jgi:proliferating cell nuclear antigen